VSARPTPRIRVFAGPNGSGKSTLLDRLSDSNVPLYCVINPDAIEKHLNANDGLALADYGLKASKPEFLTYVKGTTYSVAVKNAAGSVQFKGERVFSRRTLKTSYNAALVASFIRTRLIQKRASFSFESVFSHSSKLNELRDAQARGYNVYLYYVAMDAPDLCIGRVKERVDSGGHAVPEEKIRKRYAASLENLLPALKLAYRAYIFDNSGRSARLLAEQTPAGNLNIQREYMPIWFATYVTDRLKPSR
jgi:predicted ABC-type ATPase